MKPHSRLFGRPVVLLARAAFVLWTTGSICPSTAYASPIVVIQPVFTGIAQNINDLNRDLSFGNAVFAQAGIGVDFLPSLVISSLPDNLTDTTTGFLEFLGDSSWQHSPVLTLWYVASINNDPSLRGESFCYGGMDGRCGIWVTDYAVSDTASHELAHILTAFNAIWNPAPDPTHSIDPYNLLAAGSNRHIPTVTGDVSPRGLNYDQIAPSQADTMLTSLFVQDLTTAVPESSSIALLGPGILLLIITRRSLRRRTGLTGTASGGSIR
jgi:hypothetical protein